MCFLRTILAPRAIGFAVAFISAGFVIACADPRAPLDPTAASSSEAAASAQGSHGDHHGRVDASGLEDELAAVRRATAPYQRLEAAIDAGYELGYVNGSGVRIIAGCVAHPTAGAMGYHYFNKSLIDDLVVDPLKPEGLVYAPAPDGGRGVRRPRPGVESARRSRDADRVRDGYGDPRETHAERQVTARGAIDATLSPNGASIAIAESAAKGARLQPVELRPGVASRSLCEDCDITADWSPGGEAVLLGRGLPSRLFVYDLGSNRNTEFASHPRWSLHNARFSPDGKWVAFHTTNSPNLRQVYAAATSGTAPSAVQSWVPIVTDHGCHPSWSADASLVYHFSFRDGAFCPWVQRVDQGAKRPVGAPSPVVHLHGARLRVASGAAATNDVQGGYLYFTATESTGHIWLRER